MNNHSRSTCLEVELRIELDDFPLEAKFSACQELLVLFGPSGAGKSTILRTLAGLLTPQHGSIRLNDRMLFDSQREINLPPQARRIGYVPQQYGLFPHMTIAENIAYGLPPGLKRERAQQVDRWVSLMRLGDQADRKPSEVSGGQQQRAALARAMASGPELLLMDEPFAALDEELRSHLREEIRGLSRTFNLPILIVTHDATEAYSLADHIVVFERGILVQDGGREDVFNRPATPSLARLLGMNNIYPARVTGSGQAEITLEWLGRAIKLRSQEPISPGPVLIGVRPGEIMLAERDPAGQDLITLRGRLVEIMPTGFDQLLRLELTDSNEGLLMDVRAAQHGTRTSRLIPGNICALHLHPSSIHIFPAVPDPEVREHLG